MIVVRKRLTCDVGVSPDSLTLEYHDDERMDRHGDPLLDLIPSRGAPFLIPLHLTLVALTDKCDIWHNKILSLLLLLNKSE